MGAAPGAVLAADGAFSDYRRHFFALIIHPLGTMNRAHEVDRGWHNARQGPVGFDQGGEKHRQQQYDRQPETGGLSEASSEHHRESIRTNAKQESSRPVRFPEAGRVTQAAGSEPVSWMQPQLPVIGGREMQAMDMTLANRAASTPQAPASWLIAALMLSIVGCGYLWGRAREGAL